MEENKFILLQDKLKDDDFKKELLEADLLGNIELFTERNIGMTLTRAGYVKFIEDHAIDVRVVENSAYANSNGADKCNNCGATGTLTQVDPSSIIGLNEPWRMYCTKCNRIQW